MDRVQKLIDVLLSNVKNTTKHYYNKTTASFGNSQPEFNFTFSGYSFNVTKICNLSTSDRYSLIMNSYDISNEFTQMMLRKLYDACEKFHENKEKNKSIELIDNFLDSIEENS